MKAPSSGYMPHVDGLRCVAVMSVLLFHFGIPGLDGGYVGVDVFFVISGYLIAGILLNDLSKGRFSFIKFYERRARRILPALFLVMVVTIPFAWLWMLPRSFKEFSVRMIAFTS